LWRVVASRTEIARRRMADRQSSSITGDSISPKTMSTMPSRSSSLLATCLYSAMGATPSSCASRRVLKPSTPPSPASASAASSTIDLLRRVRPVFVSWVIALDKCTPYTYSPEQSVHRTPLRERESHHGKFRTDAHRFDG